MIPEFRSDSWSSVPGRGRIACVTLPRDFTHEPPIKKAVIDGVVYDIRGVEHFCIPTAFEAGQRIGLVIVNGSPDQIGDK